jgi:hypothetical protein
VLNRKVSEVSSLCSGENKITGSQALFAMFAGLLRLQVLRFFCFITLSASLSHLISGFPLFCPSCRRPGQYSLRHLLPSVLNTLLLLLLLF